MAKDNDELGAFAGPGYSGFGGSAGYSGSGAGGIAGGYAGGAYAAEAPNTGEPWRPAPDTHQDDRIHDEVRQNLERADDVNPSEIQVSVEASVVTLSGQVSTREMKRAAGEVAERVPGVHRVHNNLHIQQPLVEEIKEKLAAASGKLL